MCFPLPQQHLILLPQKKGLWGADVELPASPASEPPKTRESPSSDHIIEEPESGGFDDDHGYVEDDGGDGFDPDSLSASNVDDNAPAVADAAPAFDETAFLACALVHMRAMSLRDTDRAWCQGR